MDSYTDYPSDGCLQLEINVTMKISHLTEMVVPIKEINEMEFFA